MYRDMTFGVILGRMLDNIPDDVDKREGSVIYDALAPAALELARFYSALGDAVDETFADTAGREMLIRRAAERGITPYSATYAVVKGEFNTAVPDNSRFAVSDGFRYRVIGHISGNDYKLVCETSGAVGNRTVGDLRPVDYIEGLNSAKITGLLIPGEDEEDTEHLRARYFDSIDSRYYGGNIADYRRLALSFQGVGAVKVYPAYYGGGTVRLVIQNSDFYAPSQEMVNYIRHEIDPYALAGTGTGIAPIGHIVVVEPVNCVAINVSGQFVMRDGYIFSDNDTVSELNGVLEQYFRELSSKWESSDALTVNASQTEARILDAMSDKIQSIGDFKISRYNTPWVNSITLLSHQIPVKGDVTNAV